MVRRKKIFMLVAMTVALPALARNCEKDATNMAEIRACVADEQSLRLATTFDRTLSFVRSKDPQAAELLVKAQKSWEKFAGDSCEFTARARQDDRMANDARLMCRQSFTDARIEILNVYRRDFDKAP
jgi:uncharacterized protein YecT (DUF1311 family)